MLNYLWKAGQAQLQENMTLTRKWLAGMNHFNAFCKDPDLADRAERQMEYDSEFATLYHYTPQQVKPGAAPLLIVYALVNKTYMLDLTPKRSFIRSLLNQGLDVYLLDWKDPAKLARKPTLENYVFDGIQRGVEYLCQKGQAEGINLLSICQGGTLSLMYTSLFPQRIKNLVTVVTPVDFQAGNSLFAHISKHSNVANIADYYGAISGDTMNSGFLQLKPFDLMIGKYLALLELCDSPEKIDNFMRMEKWIYDSPAQSGPAWAKFLTECYQKNSLIKGTFQLGGRPIELSQIRCPILNVTAEHDHLVPEAGSTALKAVVGSTDYAHRKYPVGHIGMFVSGIMPSRIVPEIAAWLREHTLPADHDTSSGKA
jgi:polyhydroxyalkanoate synthase